MNHIYYLNESIPYTINKSGKEVCLNQNKKDYPDKVNQIIWKKYPKVNTIQHSTHYNERIRD